MAANSSETRRGDCGYRGAKIFYADRTDLTAACLALADTLAYFRKIGFRLQPRFSLAFENAQTHPTDQQPFAYGHFDPNSLGIGVHAASTTRPWGLPWNKRLALSFARHELVHMAVWQILGGDTVRLPREWHEFIAYAVQLEMMDQTLRRELLARADAQPFETLEAVNEFTYGMNPDMFALAAYRTYRKRGAGKFVRQLLLGEVAPPRLGSPHPEHAPQ